MNLEFDARASGHVRVWKSYAQAAAGRDDVDLTVYFLGPRRTVEIATNVRYEVVPGTASTRRLRLRQGGGHADIGFYNRQLARLLERHDVIHTTDFFSFGATGRRVARRQRKPFIYSVHTLQPEFSRIYWPEISEGIFGQWLTSRFLIKILRTDDLIFWFLSRGLRGMLKAADAVMVFHPDNLPAGDDLPRAKLLPLRRGSDIRQFSPTRREPVALRRQFAIPEDRVIVLFVGRIDETKSARLVATALAHLVAEGIPVHGLFVGAGRDTDAVRGLLGAHASLAGVVPHEDLPAIYASADLLVFPARYETWGNVVIEAKASGLPVLVGAGLATARHIQRDGDDGVVVKEHSTRAWAEAIRALATDADQRTTMGAAARRWAETVPLSWEGTVGQDLVPVWRRLAGLA